MSTTLDANSKDLAQAPDDTELLKDTERSSSKVDPQPTPQHGAVGGATPGTKDDSISAASDNVDQGSDPRPADGEGREKEAGKNKGGPPPFFEASVRSDATSFLFLLVVGLVIYAWRLHKKVKRMRLEGTLVATLKEELRELKQTIEFSDKMLRETIRFDLDGIKTSIQSMNAGGAKPHGDMFRMTELEKGLAEVKAELARFKS